MYLLGSVPAGFMSWSQCSSRITNSRHPSSCCFHCGTVGWASIFSLLLFTATTCASREIKKTFTRSETNHTRTIRRLASGSFSGPSGIEQPYLTSVFFDFEANLLPYLFTNLFHTRRQTHTQTHTHTHTHTHAHTHTHTHTHHP